MSVLLSPTEAPTKEEMVKAMRKAKTPEAAKEHLKMVVYGKPKRGKTHFLGTLPRPLILDFDGGAGILANKRKFPNFDGRIVTVESWDDVHLWYWILKTQKHPFQSVAFDTLTKGAELALVEILGAKAIRTKGQKDPYKAEQDDYGRTGRILKTWITMFLALDMHVVFSLHEREDDAPDEEDGENIVRWMVPDLQGSARNFLCGQVNIIGYAYRVSKDGKVSFRMAFDRPGTVAADRYNVLPRVMPNPSYSKIMKYYTKEEEVDGGSDD